MFTSPVYHVNVSEEDNVMCLAIIDQSNWKPAVKMSEGMISDNVPQVCNTLYVLTLVAVLEALIQLLEHPDPSHPVRVDLGSQFVNEPSTYNKVCFFCSKVFLRSRKQRNTQKSTH